MLRAAVLGLSCAALSDGAAKGADGAAYGLLVFVIAAICIGAVVSVLSGNGGG